MARRQVPGGDEEVSDEELEAIQALTAALADLNESVHCLIDYLAGGIDFEPDFPMFYDEVH